MGASCTRSQDELPVIQHRVDLQKEIIKPDPAQLSVHSFPDNPSFEFVIDYSGENSDIPDELEIKSESIDLKDIAYKLIFGLSHYLSKQYEIEFFDKSKIEENTNKQKSTICYRFEGTLCLGLVVEFCLINRPHNLKTMIIPKFENAESITLGYGPKFKTSQPQNLLNKQGPPNKEIVTNMKEYIHSYHLHCHFYDENGHSEALGLYHILLEFLKQKKVIIIGNDIMYGTNGPHTCWNWQIFVENAESLGIGLCFLSVNGQQKNGVFLPFHARCFDIEGNGDLDAYLDHTLRLGWIGQIDTHHNANMEPDKSPRLKQYYVK